MIRLKYQYKYKKKYKCKYQSQTSPLILQLLLLLILLLPLSSPAGTALIDQSHEIFLTEKLSTVTKSFREYPIFWWDFVTLEGDIKREAVPSFCDHLAQEWKQEIKKLPCNFKPETLSALTHDWLEDLPRRQPMPEPAKIKTDMNSVLVKAAMPLPRDFLNLLRTDPFNALGDLRSRLEARSQFNRPVEGGAVFDEASHRVLIPVQLSYSPAESARTKKLLEELPRACAATEGCKSADMFGPHSSTLENEARIREDIGSVSSVGTAGMLLLCLFIFFSGRWRLALLMPILLAGLGLATLATIWMYGKIHGITLAFGPGIAGLAMDYGVHAVFLNPRSKQTWRSNLAGLLTTIVILLIMLFSAIPLLRQMMFFSLLGLCLSFLLFFLILHKWPKWFETKPYNITPFQWRPGEWLALVLLAASPLVFFRPLALGVSHLNYESPRTAELRSWFTGLASASSPYWVEEDTADPLNSAHKTRAWAAQNKIDYEGLAAYLPSATEQQNNLQSWRSSFCPERRLEVDATMGGFFEPFFEFVSCGRLQPRDPTKSIPDYAADFQHGGRWVSLLFPSKKEDIAAIRAQFPTATTPRDVFEAFPRIFLYELLWMVPVAMLGAFVFLWRHFHNVKFAGLALVPFFTGVGCYALVSVLLQLQLSFIALIGLLMVFGFSLDYGIFVVDLLHAKNEHKFGVWSALTVCSFATLAGFAPLVFARHPVMDDLGQALLWGSLGTYLGTYWGIPALFRRLEKESAP